MPLDPATGLYDEGQGSRFPAGTFGGALKIGNSQIAQRLSSEAANRRALEDHLLDLQGQNVESQMNSRTKERQDVEDEQVRKESFGRWIEQNIDAPLESVAKAAVAYGQDPKPYVDMMYKSGQLENTKDKNSINLMDNLRKEVKDKQSQGIPAAQYVPSLKEKYTDEMFQPYFEKLMGEKQAPMVAATIAARTAQAGASNATAGKAAGVNDAKVDEELRKYDQSIINARLKVKQLPIMQQRAAMKQVVEPLVQQRDAYAIKHDRPPTGTPTAIAPVQPPANPSPSSTAIAQPKVNPPKCGDPIPGKTYKPNCTYRIDGKIVTTDQNGDIIR